MRRGLWASVKPCFKVRGKKIECLWRSEWNRRESIIYCTIWSLYYHTIINIELLNYKGSARNENMATSACRECFICSVLCREQSVLLVCVGCTECGLQQESGFRVLNIAERRHLIPLPANPVSFCSCCSLCSVTNLENLWSWTKNVTSLLTFISFKWSFKLKAK